MLLQKHIIQRGAAIAAVTAVVVTVAALVAIHFSTPEDLGSKVFLERFSVELVLPKSTGSIRTVDFYPDKITRKSAVEDHANGTTTHYHYRPDGTLSDAVVYAKVEENVSVRPVIRKSVMATDGVTYREDTEYDIIGRVTKLVALQADGTTTRRYFHPNGQLAKDQLMARDDSSRWKLMNERAFLADGSKERVLVVTKGVDAVDTLYGPGEVVRAVRTTDLRFGKYQELWFDTDGKTAIREVQQNSNRTEVVVRRKDGSLSEKFTWIGSIETGSLTALVMDEASNKRLEQTLYFIEGQLRMRSIEVYQADGRKTDLVVFRTYGKDAGTVEFIANFDTAEGFAGPHTRREFRTDDTLEVVKKQADSKTTISEQRIPPQQKIKPNLDSDWTTVRSVPLPPQVIAYIESREH